MMKPWTSTAGSRLEEYLRQRVEREGLHGEDAAELRADLRHHIHEEAERDDAIETVGLMQLEKLLARMDGDCVPPLRPPSPPLPPRRTWYLWCLGVWLPLLVIIVEKCTGICAEAFFDPMPTLWHLFMLLLVPAGNWLLLSRRECMRRAASAYGGIASGCAIGVALFYAVLYLPMVIPGMVAVVFFLFGLLPLSPLLALVASWKLRGRLVAGLGNRFVVQSRMAAVVVLGSLLLSVAPGLWTRMKLAEAQSANRLVAAQALESLRRWGNVKILLFACYERPWGLGQTEISGWLAHGWANMLTFGGISTASGRDPNKARDLFYQVTGGNFNSHLPPFDPKPRWIRGGRNFAENDEDHGGDAVAGRIRFLELAESRYDGHLDQRCGIAYGEWTMVFHNGSSVAREARCLVRVPCGGRVSRLTLWINGEPCEAAFGGVSQVKAAYKEVAVAQRRDPVLVNLVGPDTFMVQCFPVPANGDMKIRFGITSPIESGRSQLPEIIEQNFGLRGDLRHAVWLQSDHPFDLLDPAQCSMADGNAQSLVSESDHMGCAIECRGVGVSEDVLWCRDRFATPLADGSPGILVAKRIRHAEPAVKKWIIVVDGSTAMGRHAGGISTALDGIPADVIFATDEGESIQIGEIASRSYRGGFDNEPALYQALQKAKQEPGSALLWLHGAQAMRLTRLERLSQLLERGGSRIPFYAATMDRGPNRLLESIGRTGGVQLLPVHATNRDGLRVWLMDSLRQRDRMDWEYIRPGSPPPAPACETNDQLARLWAVREVNRSNDGLLAARYQLVTHVSGAVVLENAAQYARHGLEQIDASTAPAVPNIPEPSAAMLFLTSLVVVALRRRVVR